MAEGTRPIGRRPATVATAGIVPGIVLGLGAVAALALAGDGGLGGGLGARTLTILESALLQASLSAAFSAAVAVPAAVSLARHRHAAFYPWAKVFCGAAFITPSTVAAAGLLEVWGRKGLVASICHTLGMPGCDSVSVYGLHGVVLAHGFLNIPLMVLVFLPLLEAIPPQYYGLAHHLGIRRRWRFRMIEWPAIRPALPGALALVFLLCFSSFALVLMLGGGPKVTTLEVEIYAAIRFDFDFAAAAGLSLVQIGCAALVVAAIALLGGFHAGGRAHDGNATPLPFGDARVWDGAVLAVFAALVLLPLAMVLWSGANATLPKVLAEPKFREVLATSIGIALASAALTLAAAMVLAVAQARLGLVRAAPLRKALIWLVDGGVMLYLLIPSIVLGTAAFIALRSMGDAFAHAFWVVVLANTLLALPFSVRILEGRLRQTFRQHDRVAESLGIRGRSRWRLLTLPALERETGIVLGLAAAVSIGDLGVIALFASDALQTLPWLLYQTAGRYQAEEAKALALALLLLAVGLLVLGRMAPRLAAGRKTGKTHA